MLKWDSEQYMVQLVIHHKGKEVRDKLTLGVVDTGSCSTLLDHTMVAALGLIMRQASEGEFGCYMVPGAKEAKAYWGMVAEPVHLTIAPGVDARLENIRVVERAAPLLLIGADVLRGGRPGEWYFAGIC